MAHARLALVAPWLSLIACEDRPPPPTLTDAVPEDSGDASGDTGASADSRPLGDNLQARGTSAVEFLEPTATLWLGGDRVLLCSGTNGLGL